MVSEWSFIYSGLLANYFAYYNVISEVDVNMTLDMLYNTITHTIHEDKMSKNNIGRQDQSIWHQQRIW